ncbi:MAG: AAA family ATPase, partial [Proteobacteria bacterium]|nr:AAA family ATPase [Pseudomonadota bacterium]
MQFNRIRLSGFKSFVDPTELFIEPGLTGIVGPNGCGKSNLVEALRWVMGETSAKRIRGAGMEDVIFAGSGSRPARNIAEVSLLVENTLRNAPAAYNDETEIEVTRRIERDGGSRFTVNGQEARARDVQRLFADAASGAHSTALVSQGEIGALIKAKPEDRRLLLEEAAGITGLHSRRHEAELRLRAADANLERLDDVMATLAGQLQGLKRQARQATRYRNLSGHIRKAEATLLYATWMLIVGQIEGARSDLSEHDRVVVDTTEAVARATSALEAAAALLPPLRQEEAAAAAKVHRLDVAGEQLNAEEQRVLHERTQLEGRRAQIDSRSQRESTRLEDASASIAKLADERQAIARAQTEESGALEDAATQLKSWRLRTTTIETELAGLTEQLAETEADRRSLRQALDNATQDLVRRNERRIVLRDQRDQLIGQEFAPAQIDVPDLAVLQGALQTARDTHEASTTTLESRREAETEAQEEFRKVEGDVSRLRAEETALASLLGDQEGDLWPALIDAVTVETGYEAALAAALGDELNVAADIAAPAHWREIAFETPAPALPSGALPIGSVTKAPKVLDRRLSQIGVVPDEITGTRLQPLLQQGQRLVTRQGALWRWDGYTVTSDAPTMALTRLNQRGRLRDLRTSLEEIHPTFEMVRTRVADAKTASSMALADQTSAHQALLASEDALFAAREAIAEARRDAAELQAQLQSLANGLEEIASAERALNVRRREILAKQQALPEIGILRTKSDQTRHTLAQARAQLDQVQATYSRLQHEVDARR